MQQKCENFLFTPFFGEIRRGRVSYYPRERQSRPKICKIRPKFDLILSNLHQRPVVPPRCKPSKQSKYKTWGAGGGGGKKKSKTKQKDNLLFAQELARLPSVLLRLRIKRRHDVLTPTTSTVVVSSSCLSDRLFRIRLLRDFAKKSWVLVQIFVCIVFVIFLEAKQKRQELSCTDRQTDRQTDWLTDWEADKTRQTDKADTRVWKEDSLHRPISR